MCGIIGVFNDHDSVQKVVQGLKVMENRGKDGCGVAFDGRVIIKKDIAALEKEVSGLKSDNCLGHCLHSVVGFVPQPIKQDGILVANCEIYNWKELSSKYSLDARNDSELIIGLIEKLGFAKINEVIEELDGAFAFAYWNSGKLILCRDIFGVKPLWYFHADGKFAFVSERKALERLGYTDVRELNPREILTYDSVAGVLSAAQRDFLNIAPEHKKTKDEILFELTGLVIDSVSKRLPDQKFGILFSGGIDSTLIAQICKRLGVQFTCYTAALDSPMVAEDLEVSKKIAQSLGFEIKVKTIKMGEVETYLKKVVPLIEDSSVVNSGVGLTFYVACELARKDGIKVIFSGLGSEELFAGYERHRDALNVNNECVSGLLKIYQKDTYRDDCVTMNNNLELRLPFLDRKLAEYAMKIPAKYKLDDKQNKKIIREVAERLGVPSEFAQRKKRAAQYGSRFDNAIEKLAHASGMKSKSAYLDRFYRKSPILGVLFSSGKDSTYAAWIMKRQNYKIRCLITIKSENPDSYMFHTPNVDVASLQALAMNIPIIFEKTKGEKEIELADMKRALMRARDEYGIEGVVTGALYSQYQRERIEKVCDSLGLKIFSPLWHIDQEKEMRELLNEGFEFIISSIAAEGLNERWLGKLITNTDVDALVKLNKRLGLNVAFEGGEAETLVLNCPMFKKKLVIKEAETVMENECTGRYIVVKAVLE